MKKFFKRLRRRRQLDLDLEDEFRFHLEMKAEDTGDAGEARRRLGNVTLLKEACREIWTFALLESWWMDIRYAIRSLGNNRGVTLVAVTALGLGIGANTAVFTIFNGALSFDAGIDKPDRVVLVSANGGLGQDELPWSDANFRSLRSQVKLASLAAYRYALVNVSDKSALPERYSCAQMSATGFSIIGRRPVLGRSFEAYDERPGATPIVVLTHHVWQDRYGKDASILGRVIRVDEVPRVVVGVMPPGTRFPEDIDLWVPLLPKSSENQDITMFGRLTHGVELAAARSEMDTIARRLLKNPNSLKGPVIRMQPVLVLYGVYESRPLFLVLLCAVGFVLLIACANVANLLLARSAVRSREISIRIAIGAGRARIIRQLLVESVVLSLAGGLFGWLLALSALHWFDSSLLTFPKPPWLDLSMNTTVFVYLAAISIGTGCLFGLAPALQLAKVDVNNAIKSGGNGAVGGMRGRHLSSLLVALEMALCVVLLTGSGLMIRSAINLYGTPIGVNTASVLTMRIDLPEAKYPRPDDEVSFHKRLQTRVESLPGVEAAAVTSHLPNAGWIEVACELEGRAPAANGQLPAVGALVVSRDYFRAMQLPARLGRLFTDSDGAGGSLAVIVNESFAAKFWRGEDPLGKHLRPVNGRKAYPWLTVIGVVPDVHQNFRRSLEYSPLIYLSYTLEPQRTTFIVARTRVPPNTLVKPFRQEVQSIDENLPVYDVRSLEDRISHQRLDLDVVVGLFTIFAAIALVLGSVGLYALIAHSVSQRTREIGLRMAVGGTSRDIVTLVFAQGLRQILLGLAAGLLAAFALTRVLRGVLVGVSPVDPLTFLSVVVVLILVGILGCAIPARRAVRVDPVAALRAD